MTSDRLDDRAFTERLREVGAGRYHDKHPFHVRMNEGRLGSEAIRGWVANRFHYQKNIPIKDAAIISNCPIREVRRGWLRRIVVHDGAGVGEGGIEAWLKLGEACGLARQDLLDERDVLPGVRFAVDAYVNFARVQPWPVAVASSLTELFAPDLMAQRLAAFETHYKWVNPSGLEYFRRRLTQAREDSEEGLRLTLTYCDTRALQEEAIKALMFKCDVLWAMLDAIEAECGRSAA
ncbi:MAG: pyrroloquinoline quinone biosynthesis protein C [Verrucomicrobia bacterium]|nr:MAG: pyrroloquinoline quinone biosynthesis protein C [Verrucomicrobiota bacterium]